MKKNGNLFDHLPKNYAQIIKKKLSVSEVFVYKVRVGKRNNTDILEMLVELAKTEKKRKEDLLTEINK